MDPMWPQVPTEGDSSGKAIEVPDAEVADVGPEVPDRTDPLPSLNRPLLHRNQQSQPPPPAVPQPPPLQSGPPSADGGPPAPGGGFQQQQPPDSLSLAQLRRIVAEFPRAEPIAYDYVYTDMAPIEEEVDEWFVYNFWQWVRLNTTQRSFYAEWAAVFEDERPWEDASEEDRKMFVTGLVEGVRDAAAAAPVRSSRIGALTYLVLGRWSESIRDPVLPRLDDGRIRSAAAPSQLAAMKAGVELVAQCGGVGVVWDALRRAFEPFWSDDAQQQQQQSLQGPQDELANLMTVLYMIIQETLSDPFGLPAVRTQLLALEPGLLSFMLDAAARLRWDETPTLPHTQIFLLFWKSVLLVFGGSKDIVEAKKATSETDDDLKDGDTITASPLDYHVFRQEVTSKYPAYVPPQSAMPLEAEHTSLIPQLPNHPTRSNAANGIIPAPANTQSGGASILHQPVHIATPAPSPPPSPGVGGKGGKKQNYQTNQNFPFMYPPLDPSSNSTGGKGGAALQDLLVGRKWEGSDVPASILEAGELFSKRVRTARATRQLWEEREKFLKFERGWDDEPDDDILDELDLSSLTLEEQEELGLSRPRRHDDERAEGSGIKVDIGPRSDIDPQVRERLEAVEIFYRDSLPHLQSLVIVLLRAIVSIATNPFVQPANGQQQQHPAVPNNGRANGVGRGPEPANAAPNAAPNDLVSPTEEEIDAARAREISAKAVTGILVLLLKWFKLSHVLKFEYLTQLLLDSNYIQLALKILAANDVQQVVESKTDRLEHSFFYFCNVRAGGTPNPAAETTFEEDEDEESEDEAAPPPIKRRRSPASEILAGPSSGTSSNIHSGSGLERPEVDELGYPVNPLPKEPITDFSRRNFFSLINYLRVAQKICKNKAHRNLMLVHVKSSTILRKALKVPQQQLRLYTLKLFKSQVPYCGRKWRQSHMRVITAVYLHCRPELRDGWLAGSDVDAEVEEALPLEQALRSLTHWFNVRTYPDQTAPEARAALREEQDFFVRELDKLDLNWADVTGEDSVAGSEWGGEQEFSMAG